MTRSNNRKQFPFSIGSASVYCVCDRFYAMSACASQISMHRVAFERRLIAWPPKKIQAVRTRRSTVKTPHIYSVSWYIICEYEYSDVFAVSVLILDDERKWVCTHDLASILRVAQKNKSNLKKIFKKKYMRSVRWWWRAYSCTDLRQTQQRLSDLAAAEFANIR